MSTQPDFPSNLRDTSVPKKLDNEIHFVHVGYQSTAKSALCTTNARSHVMRRFHQLQQLTTKQKQTNFRHVTAEQMQKKRKKEIPNAEEALVHYPRDDLALGLIDPFDCFATDTSELPVLLDNRNTLTKEALARQAGEAVINFNSKMGFQGLHTVYQSNIADPVLLNAILLTLTFAVHSNPTNTKFLTYKGETLRWINERLQDPQRIAVPATIGAILLLIGVEAQLGDKENVQMHMNGILLLMQLCNTQNVSLHDGIKRAVFWQDLVSAVLTGSRRVLNHESFAELAWKRDPLRLSIFEVPAGFEASAGLLGDEFLSIMKDIKALQAIRDGTEVDQRDAVSIMHLDNHQASVESRLYDIGKDPQESENPALYSCIVAAYLCTYMLFTDVWSSGRIPSHLTSRLLGTLRSSRIIDRRIEHWSLFLWVTCIGGTFATSGNKQREYSLLLNQQIKFRASELTESGLHDILQNFVWSEKTFGKRLTVLMQESGL